MAGTQGALHVIEVVSEHLCQDLCGLMGPLHQAVSTADSEPLLGADREETALDAARRLISRLQLWRAAWGPDDGPASLERIQRLARGLPEHITLDVSGVGQTTVFLASAGRVLLNLLLLTTDALPKGGTVTLVGDADDLFIRIDGPEAAWPPGMAICLANETEARAALVDPRSLQMAMTALLAHAGGIRLSVLLASAAQSVPAILRLGG